MALSYCLLDEIAEVEAVKGVMLQFDEFVSGVQLFGEHVQPKMKSRIGKMMDGSSKRRRVA